MTEIQTSGRREPLRFAIEALQRGDHVQALALLMVCQGAEPENIEVKLNIALACRMSGNLAAAIAALDQALAIDPYQFMALLSKASILEQMGRLAQAAQVYQNALALAPPRDQTPASLEGPIAHARQVVEQQAAALAHHVEARLAQMRAAYGEAATGRFDACLDVFLGRKKVYVQEPHLLHFPGLPALQFYPRAMFPWLAELEAATEVIRDELLALRAREQAQFRPYIDFPPGSPLNQWADLNGSLDWTSCWLWRDSVPQDEIIALCPKTSALLARLPMAHQSGFAPTAVFSSLRPHTHIPAHTGSTNARLLVHLPLVLPGPSRFRVGHDERSWRMGEAWVFDDTIEHEAWNDADETRTLLIFDIWNPFLSQPERDMISAMLAAKNEFQQLPG